MALFGNFDQPGRGIPKAPVEKKGIFKFFEIYGRKCWKLMGLNVLYFMFFCSCAVCRLAFIQA